MSATNNKDASWAEKVDPAKVEEEAKAALERAQEEEALKLLEAFDFDIIGGVRQIMNSEAV